MNTECSNFIKKAREYEKRWRDRYYAASDGADDWYELIHQHIEQELLPQIKRNSEVLIEYWPIWFVIGREYHLKSGVLTDKLFLHEYGGYGTGYIVIANQKIYIATFYELANRYPVDSAGVLPTIVRAMNSEINSKKAIRQDHVWEIGEDEFIGSQIQLDRNGSSIIKLQTSMIVWDIYPHFSNHLNMIQDALTCFRFNHFRVLKPRHYIQRKPKIYPAPLRTSRFNIGAHAAQGLKFSEDALKSPETMAAYVIVKEKELPDELPGNLILTINVEAKTKHQTDNALMSVK